MGDQVTDEECLAFLRLLHKYVTEYGDCADMQLSDLAEDLAMSMDHTTDEADRLRVEITTALGA